ncbi:SNF2 family N-terminal domain-domain-containing protein [Phakopsora pachyrhizi]|uniref:SNF2 family N-terminal domain-domain-containing protein n=1 Tax=Phakopsora pachyrhizi TaxID=170000 RepID=A0AAV0BLK7_PHAPC|nr:SNF2 family N-terminal domain-domain-containing protein [Phakopsora pachyrhizi]
MGSSGPSDSDIQPQQAQSSSGGQAHATNDPESRSIDDAEEFDRHNAPVSPYNAYVHPITAYQNVLAQQDLYLSSPNRALSLPSLLPIGLDPYTIRMEQEKAIETRIRWRLAELESMSANLPNSEIVEEPVGEEASKNPSSQKLKALIAMKSLQLLSKQKALREEVLTGFNQATKLSLVLDRTAIRRPKKLFLRDAIHTEQVERRQKAEREQEAKQKHLDHISSIQKHSYSLKFAQAECKEAMKKLGKSVLKFHVEAEKEEQRRIERLSKERLKALKADDEEAYMKLVDTAKDTRITHLLRQTDQYLDSLSQAVVKQQNEAIHQDGEIFVNQDQTNAGSIDESAFGAAPVFDEDRVANNPNGAGGEGKADYYNVSHRIKEEVTKQSSLLTGGTLKEYQIKGLQWMVSLYNNRLNGILADEMGLGKTIQTISLITWLIEHKNQPGPYLVIVPLSTLPNWTLEFEKWAPSIKIIVYKGSPNVRKQIQNQQLRNFNFQVLLTTYEYIIKDRPALCKIKWVHMIIDEGHRMKNSQSKLSLTLTTHYVSRHRLILTGTPLQNNLPELWALLNFVLPKVFNSVKSFDEWFNTPFANTGGQDKIELNEEEAILVIRRLHKVLRPFLLRRLKKDVESELPDKVERVIKCKMSALQMKLTNTLKVHKVIWTDVGNGAKGATGGVMKGLQNMIMQLKKICNHPFTYEEVERTINGPNKPTNDTLWRTAGKFELLDRILPKLFCTGHRVLMFFQMTQVMDIFQDYCAYRGIKNLRLDGTTKPEERADLLKTFNHPECDVHLFILSTRAGGLGLNLQTADTVIIFDSDWNPHQDLQAQDRAHRIGQKKEVRVLRLITSKSVEEHIMSKAQFKLDMDKKVIQAGRFDHKSSAEERELFLRELLEDDDNEEEDDNELGDEELNEILKRSDEEFEIFTRMDRDRTLKAIEDWKRTPEGQAGKPVPERLMTLEELPPVYSKENAPPVIDPNAIEDDNGEPGARKPRNRNEVHYDDGLTEEQFLEALENEEDLTEVIAKKRGKRAMRLATKSKRREPGDDDDNDEEDDGEEDEEFQGSGPSRSRGSKLSRNNSSNKFSNSPEPNRKRKRLLTGSLGGNEGTLELDEERGQRKAYNKKRKNNFEEEDETVLNGYRKVMRGCYDALMKPIAPDSGERRINLFVDLVNRKQFMDYYQIIKKPIAMRQINKNIQNKYKNLKQFKDDIHLMFDNARIYNETGSYVYVQADELQEYFDHVFECYVDEEGRPRAEPLPIRDPNPDIGSQASGSESESEDGEEGEVGGRQYMGNQNDGQYM